MILDSFRQDVRVGLRVLFKDKTFCFLAVLVLGLGIGGATTQFTVVNASRVARIFFSASGAVGDRWADRSESERSKQQFRIRRDSDSAGLRRFESGAEVMLVDGRLSQWIDNKRHLQEQSATLYRRLRHRRFFQDHWCIADYWTRFHRRGQQTGRGKGHHSRRRNLETRFQRRSQTSSDKTFELMANPQPSSALCRRILSSRFRGTLDAALQSISADTARPARASVPNNAAPAVMGRLKPGVTLDQANAEFIASCSPVGARTIQRRTKISHRRRVQPLANSFIGVQFRQTVWAMLAAVILVLLIACVNVMNMQFGRAALRAKELAIRGALGATRWRLVRQMLTESLVVAVFGAVAGSSLGLLGRRLADPRHGRAAAWVRHCLTGFDSRSTARVLAFIVGITLVATIVSGLVPALLSATATQQRS